MPPVPVPPEKVCEFASFDAFYAWLANNHANADEVWIRIFKKGAGKPTITPVEAIDAVLCWGWIDAIRKSWDEQSYVQRYCPRRAKSVWSQVNRDNVARLVEQGLMTEHGLVHVAGMPPTRPRRRPLPTCSPPLLLTRLRKEPMTGFRRRTALP
jgi:uncharacterized protein YdeI (YjbR/CyaY-like superfamily)